MIEQKMRDFAHARAEKLSPIPMKHFPSLTDFTTTTWLGTFSWSNQTMRQRIIDADAIVNLYDVPQVPPEIARDYLRAKYTEKRRHTQQQFMAINETRAAPLFAKTGFFTDMALIDLKSAYWSIIQIVGWDVDYNPSRWLGKRSENDDFPIPDNKVARNSLVSAGLLTPTHLWDGKSLLKLKAHNPYINYSLWACVMDVLHSVGTIALKAGAVHIHTDGYILPMKHAALFINELRSWGLTAIVKETGEAAIKGVGSYRIGTRKTKKQYHFTPRTFSNIYTPDISFLKPRIAKLARAKIDWSIHDNEQD